MEAKKHDTWRSLIKIKWIILNGQNLYSKVIIDLKILAHYISSREKKKRINKEARCFLFTNDFCFWQMEKKKGKNKSKLIRIVAQLQPVGWFILSAIKVIWT